MNDRMQQRAASLTPKEAWFRAMTAWGVMLVVQFVCIAASFFFAGPGAGEQVADYTGRNALILVVVFSVVIPAAGFGHWWMFRRYWAKGVVLPQGYLRASLLFWGVITACVIVSSVVSFVNRSALPNILFSGVLLLLMLAAWPKGKVMTTARSRRDEDTDSEVFHLPGGTV